MQMIRQRQSSASAPYYILPLRTGDTDVPQRGRGKWRIVSIGHLPGRAGQLGHAEVKGRRSLRRS